MVTGVTTSARSGPYCEAGCAAPLLRRAEFAPRDYLWIYPTLLMVLAFVTLAGALQLTGVHRGLPTGQLEGLPPLSQYNPHGVFTCVENVGCALLAGAFAPLGVALATGRSTLLRVAGWFFREGAVLTLLDLVLSAVIYGSNLGYRLEVIALVSPGWSWSPPGVLVPVAPRRQLTVDTSSLPSRRA